MSRHDYQDDKYQHTIAVVGMAGTFCNAPSLDHLWLNLKDGREAVRFLDTETLKANGCPRSMREHPMFVPATAMMTDVDRFDADFFGYTAAEARLMDPQLRLMLQTAWHAFENANLIPERMEGLTGVFAGGHRSDYLVCNLGPEYTIQTGMKALTASLFNGQDYLSTWISYKLGLTGPSVNVQTACSTGLVAVATACQNLLDYSCDTALSITGAVFSPRDWGYLAETGSILSADGHCRPYDAVAGGTITGEGVGAIVLKRLHDALEDNDSILGIIRGYAVNNDGSLKAGYATPSAAGQQALLTQALATAGLESNEITYMEGHGTGTQLGDPIEFKALQSVFGKDSRENPCFLGSVKANLGHLGACAGMVGLQKILLMLKHGTIVPQINYADPNPEMGMEGSAFQICTQLRDWPEDSPRIAGVSSFGLGGTNCHMIVEGFANEETAFSKTDSPAGFLPLCLSARSEKALEALCEKWADFLDSKKDMDLNQAAMNVLSGRAAMPWRMAIAATEADEAIQKLRSNAKGLWVSPERKEKKTVFFIQDSAGIQTALSATLLRNTRAFKGAFMACAALCKEMQGPDLPALLEEDSLYATGKTETMSEQLLDFATAFSLAHLLTTTGVRLHVVAGVGTGGLVAKALAGTISLAQAIRQLCGAPGSPAQDAVPGQEWALPEVELISTPEENGRDRKKLIETCLQGKAGIFLAVGQPYAHHFPENTIDEMPPPAWVPIPSSTGNTLAKDQEQSSGLSNAYGEALAALFRAGATIMPGRRGRHMQTPLYQFERNSYWPEQETNFCDMLRYPEEVVDKASSQVAACEAEPDNTEAENDGVSIEQCMCAIWNEALGIEDIDPDDDFFQRGGTSLSAIAIVADIRKHTGLTIQLRELMKLKTINEVTARLGQLAEEEA